MAAKRVEIGPRFAVIDKPANSIAPRPGRVRKTVLGMLLICAVSPAAADGDDFFIGEWLNSDGTRAAQGGYVGAVRDDEGGYMYDATIRIAVTVDTERGPQPLTFSAYTNILGRYRSRDPKVVFATFLDGPSDIDPARIEVTAMKEGYQMVRRINRGRLGKAGPFEIDFVLQKKMDKPSTVVPIVR